MNDTANELPVGSDDVRATVLAAFARIEMVAVTPTLIDSISDEEWLSEDVGVWKIEAGCAEHAQDELDGCDSHVDDCKVA